ncbi:hypothetical protein MRB53_036853 [Persea americana]|nr:hypothetical protein MRB53_036853 [Persea americana]
MIAKTSFAALAAFVAIAYANPVPQFEQDLEQLIEGFSIEQVVGPQVLVSGPLAYHKALVKYGAQPPTPVVNAASAAAAVQSGSVTATPQQYDESYLCPVTLGGQILNLDFDTGSSDLWVFSTELPSSESSGHTLYSPSKSSTAKQLSGYSWKISYGDGSGASGNVFADKVVIGSVTATSQAVEAATSVSSTFAQDTANNGLVGLAFSSINTVTPQKQTTFFDTVKSTLPKQLFTATLKHGKPGSYDFGFINSNKYTGSLTYTSVDSSQGFWSFTAGGYAIGGEQGGSSFSAIADTGTTLMLLDDDTVSAFYDQIDSASYSDTYGGYVFDCNDGSVPEFSVIIGNSYATVPASYLSYAPNGDGTCYGGIQSDSGIGFSILGDIFLKSQFVVFDEGNLRLGFAQQAGVTV